jgi:preprotein translocase subunit Sec63
VLNPAAVKAYALLYAHFHRIEIVDGDLKQDQAFVVSKAGKLVQGILQIALARQWLHPALSCMALSQYIVHGTWEGHSPLLQLPFITHDISRHSLTGRRAIKSIADLLDMNESDRRSLLRNLGDKEYSQALSIAQTFPMAQIDTVTFKVLGQESIVPGGLITCQVRLSLEYPRISTTEGIDDGGKEKVSIKPEDDVQTFEFDEDGNLLDDPGRKVTDSLTTARPVYSPRFPNTKRPFWWVSLVNKNNTNFVCLPVKVLDLVDRKTVTLQFPAPPKPMSVSLMLVIKSDSVMGVDITKEVKFIVMPPSGNSPNENWDISGDEEDQAVPFSSDDE